MCTAPGVHYVLSGTPQVITSGPMTDLFDADDDLCAVCAEALETGNPTQSRAMVRLYGGDTLGPDFDPDVAERVLLDVFEALRSHYLEDPSSLRSL